MGIPYREGASKNKLRGSCKIQDGIQVSASTAIGSIDDHSVSVSSC